MSSSFPTALADTLGRARRLRAAASLIDRAAPAGPERADILIRLSRLVADLERLDTQGVCGRCARTFVYSAAWFHLRGLTMPRHCDECRHARRRERDARTSEPTSRSHDGAMAKRYLK